MSFLAKGRTGGSMAAVVTVAGDTRWERRFDYGVVSYGPPKGQWLKGLLWSLGKPLRRFRKTRLEREIAAYRARIAREGYAQGL